jgi:hypothetical protein
VLFVHGGGEGTYEEDKRLVASLRYVLGAAYDVRYPKMPNEDAPWRCVASRRKRGDARPKRC